MDQTGPGQGPIGPAFGGGVYGGDGDTLRLKLREEERIAKQAINQARDDRDARDLKAPEKSIQDHVGRIRGYDSPGGLGIIGSIPEAACAQGSARAMTGREMLRRKTAMLRAEGHALIEEAKCIAARAEDRLREARNIDDLVALLPEFTGVAPGADQALVRLASGY